MFLFLDADWLRRGLDWQLQVPEWVLFVFLKEAGVCIVLNTGKLHLVIALIDTEELTLS